MKELIISKKDNEKKILNVISSHFSSLSINTLNKALRKKDIKVNNNRINKNIIVYEGDIVQLYILDTYFISKQLCNLDEITIYEDENILVINKPSKICILKDNKDEICIMDLLAEKYIEHYIPQPCHRLDRNTTGLVIFAKNEPSLNELLYCFKNRLIDKYYKCLVYGILKQKESTLSAYLFKDSVKSRVIISDKKLPYYEQIETSYTVLKENQSNNTSLLEVKLITGKTHQIRAHLAYIGHPIIGDGKYGTNSINKKHKYSKQCLTSYKIVFHTKDLDTLKYLNNKTITIKFEDFNKD